MTIVAEIERKVATYLLEMEALLLRPNNPFTWASGWRSPVYCDNRLLLSSHKVRLAVAEAFAERIKSSFGSADVIAGVATAGIPHATLTAHLLGLPLLYVRPAPKAHGTGKLIEGKLEPDQRVVVIEDLVSTGKSSLQAVEAIRQGGGEVLGLLSIFQYGFTIAGDAFREKNVLMESLTTFSTVAEIAQAEGNISERDWAVIQDWQKDPGRWRQ